MSSRLNVSEICDLLFEEIPSDDNSITSCDDSDNNNDYIPPSGELKTKPILFESSDDGSDDENSEILNLDDSNIYLLSSPIKQKKYTRSSIRRKFVSKTTEVRSRTATYRQLFPGSENASLNNENVSFNFDFHSLPSTSSHLNNDYQPDYESTPLRPVNFERVETEIETQPTQQDDFQFIPPTWSKKMTLFLIILHLQV